MTNADHVRVRIRGEPGALEGLQLIGLRVLTFLCWLPEPLSSEGVLS